MEAGTKVVVGTTASTLRSRLAGATFYVGECFEEDGVTVARLFLRRELAEGGRDWDGVRLPSAILPTSQLFEAGDRGEFPYGLDEVGYDRYLDAGREGCGG